MRRIDFDKLNVKIVLFSNDQENSGAGIALQKPASIPGRYQKGITDVKPV